MVILKLVLFGTVDTLKHRLTFEAPKEWQVRISDQDALKACWTQYRRDNELSNIIVHGLAILRDDNSTCSA